MVMVKPGHAKIFFIHLNVPESWQFLIKCQNPPIVANYGQSTVCMNLSHLAIGAQEKNILYIMGLSIARDWPLMLPLNI